MIKNLRKKFMIVAMSSMFVVLAAIVTIFNILNYVHSVDDLDRTLHMIAENDGKFPIPQELEKEPQKREEAPEPKPDAEGSDSGIESEKREGILESNTETEDTGSKTEPEKREGELESKPAAGEREPGSEPEKRPGDMGEQRIPPVGGQDRMSPEAPYQTRYFSVRLDVKGNVVSSDLNNIAAVTGEEAEQYAEKIFSSQKKKGFQGIYRYRKVINNDGVMVVFLDSRQQLESFRTNLWTSLIVSISGLFAVLVLVLFFSRLVFRPVADAYANQKRFITDASHEIKTPLTIIDANVEVIEVEHGEDEWTKSIRRQVQRMANLTQQLITLARLDEEETQKQKSEFSLTDTVRETVQAFEVLAETSGKMIETEVQDHVTMAGEERAIRQMMDLLMDNAIKYSLPESIIHVSLVKKGKRIQLEVSNETERIPVGDLGRLFERFYRLDSSRNSETGGSGIGLSVVRAIVESHHGKIRAQSDDGKSIRITAEWR